MELSPLPIALPEIIERGEIITNAHFFDPDPQFEQYFMLKPSLSLQMFVYGVVAGAPKHKEPMCTLDPSLVSMLNPRKYFSYSIGEVYNDQRDLILTELAIRNPGTFLFSPAYNLQKAKLRARLWTVSLLPVRIEGKWSVEGQVILGHCSIWPGLPYDIVGAATVIFGTAALAKLPVSAISWYAHRLNPGTVLKDQVVHSYGEHERFTSVPRSDIAAEICRNEVKMRNHKKVRAISEIPLGVIDRSFLDRLHEFYLGRTL